MVSSSPLLLTMGSPPSNFHFSVPIKIVDNSCLVSLTRLNLLFDPVTERDSSSFSSRNDDRLHLKYYFRYGIIRSYKTKFFTVNGEPLCTTSTFTNPRGVRSHYVFRDLKISSLDRTQYVQIETSDGLSQYVSCSPHSRIG